MFETVAPETFQPRSRKVFYETLPVSIAVHAAVGVALLLGNVWQVTFPNQSPRLLMLYSLAAEPTPPPPPPPPAAPKARTVEQSQPISTKMPEVAPTVIPETVPEVLPQQLATSAPVEEQYTGGVEGGIEGGIEGGVVGGELNGVDGGEIGGVEGSVVTNVAPPDTVVVKRDMPLPTAPLSMVFPKYPDEARVRGWEDMVVVRYTIGKNGRVREVTVLSRPDRALFEKVTIKAIKNWRFRPHKVNGVPQEIVHELTIFFKLNA